MFSTTVDNICILYTNFKEFMTSNTKKHIPKHVLFSYLCLPGQKVSKTRLCGSAVFSINFYLFFSVTSVEGPKYCCNVCGVVATSQAQLDMHLSGRNHKARCAKLGIQTYDQPVIPSTGPMPKTENETKSKPKKDYSIYRTPSGQYYCALCNMCVNSEQTFVQHIASRKHKLKESSAKGKKSKSKK